MALVSNSSPDSKVPGAWGQHGTHMSAPDRPHVGSMNLANRVHVQVGYVRKHRCTHGRSMFLFVDVGFVRKVRGVQAERQQFNDAFVGEGCVRVVMDRCSICVLPPSMTNCCHVTAVPVVTWPRRINLIHLMKWPWWSTKLATLQHIWLW